MSEKWNQATYPPVVQENTVGVSGYPLEHPAVAHLPTVTSEKQDTLDAPDAFSASPFYYSASVDSPKELPLEPLKPALRTEEINHKKIAMLRRSPIVGLLAGSVLNLKAYQLDMDCPPPLRVYMREQLTRRLYEKTGKKLSPDSLFIKLATEAHSAIHADGREHYTAQLSLTDLGIAFFDPATFFALIDCAEQDHIPDSETPELTTSMAIDLVAYATWSSDYERLFLAFWAKHETTYRTLAKLSFLEGVARQYTQKKLSLDGYNLALDALGLNQFPTSVEELEQPARGQKATITMLSHNGVIVPGLFQLQSRNTSHCFIHTLGEKPACFEYISDDLDWMKQKLLDALNASPWLMPYLDPTQGASSTTFSTTLVEGDLFTALTAAQRGFSLEYQGIADADQFTDPKHRDEHLLLKPIERCLAVVSALDLWEIQPEILKRIPKPLKTARRLMRRALEEKHQLKINPDHIFIRYIRGTSTTPLGDARNPANHVHVPSETSISLSEALLSNYRVDRPVGYIDNGGRTAVYTDVTGKGQWSEGAELALSAEALESLIKGINFLELMSKRLERFWSKHGAQVELSFKTTFIAQAVISLKKGRISRAGFNLLVDMLDQTLSNTITNPIQCKALGFYLQSSLIEGAQCHPCAGLLAFRYTAKPLTILYQPGQTQTFVEFADNSELGSHIQTSARDEQWRKTLSHYVPAIQQESLMYILEVWAGLRTPERPGSALRPWTDVIYAHHIHQAKARVLCEQPFVSSPFAFMRNQLKQNHQQDANDQIVTSREVSLRYWSGLLKHLQILLAPMSFLLTPAALASLAAQVGSLSLDIATAGLPGNREAEKKQATLNAVSLGLLQLAPFTPRLLSAFNKVATPAKVAARATAAIVGNRNFGSMLNRSINPRRTRLEIFFNTNSPLKTWSIPGYRHFGTLPVKAWKLERKFLLWTSDRGQARTLVVSTHGYYLPWSKTTAIPNGTELRTYAPHGYELVDPRLHRVVSQKVQPFSILTNVDNAPVLPAPLPAYAMTDKALAGTVLTGSIKNYSLSKFQSARGETYQEISHVVGNSNLSPLNGLPATPMDVLTVRNRFGMPHPDLEELFNTLSRQGIHYDRILLVHCRCSAIQSLLNRSPVYTAPLATGPIPPSP